MPRRKAKERDNRDNRYSPQDITDLGRPEAAAMLGDELRRISAALGSTVSEQPEKSRRSSTVGATQGNTTGSYVALTVQDSPTIALRLVAGVLRADIIPSTTDGYVLTTLAGEVVWAAGDGVGAVNVLNGVVDYSDWTAGVAVDGIYGTPYYYDINHQFNTETAHVYIARTINELYPHYWCQPLVEHLDPNTIRLWVYRDDEHPDPRFRHRYGRIRVHYTVVAYS